MNLYTKLEIKGEIKNVYPIGRKSTSYKNGMIYTYQQGTEKRFNFFNLFFIGFGDIAEKLEEAHLKEGDIVIMNGSLKENSYKDKKTIQLIVASFQVEESYDNAPIGNANKEDDYIPAAKRTMKKDNPYRKNKEQDNEGNDEDYPV
jgi:single-stranded DNA-binding protein